jgi:hypothetical protein
MRNPFRYFNSSPEVIRLTVMMYVRALSEQSALVGSGVQSCVPSGRQLMPLGQRSRPVQLEFVAIGEVAAEVEVVTRGGMDGGDLLQGLDVPEPGHCPLASSKRLM